MPKAKKYQHAEAFCLMEYVCQACRHREVFWNSRDGVTPFGCSCPACGETMYHENWRNDRCVPEHIPEPGQGVWIDMPKELRYPLARARIQMADGSKFEVRGKERVRMIEQVANSFRDEEPWLIRWH